MTVVATSLADAGDADGGAPTVVAPAERSLNARHLVCVILLSVSLLNWRLGDYYSGGLDPVVAAKALLSLIALGLSVSLVRAAPTRQWVGLRTVTIAGLYLAATFMGGMANGATSTNAVLVIRVVLVLITMLCLIMSTSIEQNITQVTAGLAVVGVVLAVTGLPNYAATGRLYGGVLPVNPNGIALQIGPFLLAALWRMLNERPQRFDVPLFALLLVLTWLTGSRTALIALLLGMAAIMVLSRRLPVPAALTLVAGVPVAVYVLYVSPLFAKFFERGGSQSVLTLNSRTIAWKTALDAHLNFWQQWFGRGLEVKQISVRGAYWNAQVLDSSWLSTYVQVGVIGVALLGLWVLSSLVVAARCPQPYRPILVAVVLYAAVISILETGLLDAYPLFVVMLLPCLSAEIVTLQGAQSSSHVLE